MLEKVAYVEHSCEAFGLSWVHLSTNIDSLDAWCGGCMFDNMRDDVLCVLQKHQEYERTTFMKRMHE